MRALEVVSIPARMNALGKQRLDESDVVSISTTHVVCATISSSEIFSFSLLAILALTRDMSRVPVSGPHAVTAVDQVTDEGCS